MWKSLLLLFLSSNLCFGGDAKVKFIYDNYCPWSCFTETSHRPFGFTVDLVKLIFSDSGQIEFRSSSFKRAIKEVEDGRGDIIPAVYQNDKRNLIYSVPISTTNISVAFKSHNESKVNLSKGLYPLKIGIAKGFVYSKAIEDYQQEHADLTSVVSSASAVGQLLKMINADRIDLITDNHEVLVYWKNLYKLKDINITTAPEYLSYKKDIFLAFTNNDKGQKLRDTFNRRFAELQKNGELQKLKDRYSIR